MSKLKTSNYNLEQTMTLLNEHLHGARTMQYQDRELARNFGAQSGPTL